MVSIIVPVYNVEKYLEECLNSLANQTLKNLEIIVVNDGSTDRSREICIDYCNKYDNFVFYEKENGGLMSAYLYGVERSTGEYIGFVDSDDFVENNMFEIMYNEALLNNSDIVMCNQKLLTIKDCMVINNTLKDFYDSESIEEIHNNVFPSLKGGNISSARWNKLFKREIFIENIKYCKDKSRYFEDRFIVPACLLSAKSFSYIDKPLYNYRLRKSANSKSPSPKLFDAINLIYDNQEQMLKDKNIYDGFKEKLDIAYLNYIKILFERNVILAKGKGKFDTCKRILNKRNRGLIKAHKESCVNKFGKLLVISAKLNSPFILWIAGNLIKKTYLKNSINYFD